MNVSEAVARRMAVRAFRPDPVGGTGQAPGCHANQVQAAPGIAQSHLVAHCGERL